MRKQSNNSLPLPLSVTRPEASGSSAAPLTIIKSKKSDLQSPCLSRKVRQDDDTGLAAAIPILPTTRRLSPEDKQEQRRWFVRMVARRAVAILKAKEEGK